MIYSIDELREKITPIAEKYQLRAVYLFGSYARNEATEDSDVDFLVDRTGSIVESLFDLGGLYNDLSENIEKEVDLVTTGSLEEDDVKERSPEFIENLLKERVRIYTK